MANTGTSNGVGYRIDPYYPGNGTTVDFRTSTSGGASQTVHFTFDRDVLAFSLEVNGVLAPGSKLVGYDVNGNEIDARPLVPQVMTLLGRLTGSSSNFTRYEVRGTAARPLRSARLIPAFSDSLNCRGISAFSAVTPYQPPPVVITPGTGITDVVDLAKLVQVSTPSVERMYVKNSMAPIAPEEIQLRNLSTEIDIRVGLRGAGGVSYEPSVVDLPKNSTVTVKVVFNPAEVNNLREGINTVGTILDLTTSTPVVLPPFPVEPPTIPPQQIPRLNKWFEERFTGSPEGLDSTDISVILSRPPVETRWIDTINYQDGTITAPMSIRWTGRFTFEQGTYHFKATYDDGMRVWVDGVLLIDDWSSGPARTNMKRHTMSSGEHDIRVEYFNGLTNCHAALSWNKMMVPPVIPSEIPTLPPEPDTPRRPDPRDERTVPGSSGNTGGRLGGRGTEEWVDTNDGFRRYREEVE